MPTHFQNYCTDRFISKFAIVIFKYPTTPLGVATLLCKISVFKIVSDCPFSDLNISQGSVVTPLRCGGIFKNDFIAILLMNLSVPEY